MKVLCTGGSGFIGSHLVDRLLKEGHEVAIVDRSIKYQNLTDSQHPKLRIYQYDIFGKIGDLFKDVDVVVHMAALTRPQWSIEHPYETADVNVMGTLRMLEHSRDNKVKKFIFMSSSNVYGEQGEEAMNEDMTPNPMNMYALSKWQGEQYCQLFEKLYGLNWNAIRPFNAYGPRMPVTGIYTSAIATYINAIKKGIPFVMFGTGEQKRDFVYIDDLVDMIMLLATIDGSGVFNCGSGTNYSINEVFETIKSIMQVDVKPERLPAQYEPSNTLASIRKAIEYLRWSPKVSLHDGLERTING